MSENRTQTLVLPISGKHFPNQAAGIKILAECDYVPDVLLGTSGGAVVGLMAIGSQISQLRTQGHVAFCNKVDNLLYQLNSSMYISAWYPLVPSPLLGFMLNGYHFNAGSGVDIPELRDLNLCREPEMWIGTRRDADKKSVLFCTKTSRSVLLNHSLIDSDVSYLNCSEKHVTEACLASSSIPVIVPPVRIGKYLYSDGGTCYASPLGPCMRSLNSKNTSYHVVYISPARFNGKSEPESDEYEDDNIWRRMSSSTTGMITGLHIADRNNGIRMVGPVGLVKHYQGTGRDSLSKALRLSYKCSRSFIEISPIVESCVDFLRMNVGDALKATNRAYGNGFLINHWYL